jgi:hypothetical protein
MAGPAFIDPPLIITTWMTAKSSTTDSEMATTDHTLAVGTPHRPRGPSPPLPPPRTIVPPSRLRVDLGDESSGRGLPRSLRFSPGHTASTRSGHSRDASPGRGPERNAYGNSGGVTPINALRSDNATCARAGRHCGASPEVNCPRVAGCCGVAHKRGSGNGSSGPRTSRVAAVVPRPGAVWMSGHGGHVATERTAGPASPQEIPARRRVSKTVPGRRVGNSPRIYASQV